MNKSIRHLHFTISLSHLSFPIGKYLNYFIFHIAQRNSLSMLIKAKLVRRSCSIDDLIHVFINFNFENDLSQLAIENQMMSSNLQYMQYIKLGRHPSQTAQTFKSMLRIRGNCISSNSKEYNKAKGN